MIRNYVTEICVNIEIYINVEYVFVEINVDKENVLIWKYSCFKSNLSSKSLTFSFFSLDLEIQLQKFNVMDSCVLHTFPSHLLSINLIIPVPSQSAPFLFSCSSHLSSSARLSTCTSSPCQSPQYLKVLSSVYVGSFVQFSLCVVPVLLHGYNNFCSSVPASLCDTHTLRLKSLKCFFSFGKLVRASTLCMKSFLQTRYFTYFDRKLKLCHNFQSCG